jgi:hypothetical protein
MEKQNNKLIDKIIKNQSSIVLNTNLFLIINNLFLTFCDFQLVSIINSIISIIFNFLYVICLIIYNIKNRKKSEFAYLLSYDFILNMNLIFIVVNCITLLCDFKITLIINSIIAIITNFVFFTCRLINDIKNKNK